MSKMLQIADDDLGELEHILPELSDALTPVLTVKAGEVFNPDWGPHPWGWLPPEA